MKKRLGCGLICLLVASASWSLHAKKPPTKGPDNPPPPPASRECRNLPENAPTPRYRWCEEESKYELIHLETGAVDIFNKTALHEKLMIEQNTWFDVHSDDLEPLRSSAHTELWLHIPDQAMRPARFRTVVNTSELDFVFRHPNANSTDWENDVSRLGLIPTESNYGTTSGYTPSTLLLRTPYAITAEDLNYTLRYYPVFVRESLSPRDFILDAALFHESELIQQIKTDPCVRGVVEGLDLDPIIELAGTKVKLFELPTPPPSRAPRMTPQRVPLRWNHSPMISSCES